MYVTPVGSIVYYIAYDAQYNKQLWAYAGSGSPTEVTASSVFASDPKPHYLAGVGSTLYFAATDASSHTQLWQVGPDGNAVRIPLAPPSPPKRTRLSPTVIGSTLYFDAYDASNHEQSWQVTGSAASPQRVPLLTPLASSFSRAAGNPRPATSCRRAGRA